MAPLDRHALEAHITEGKTKMAELNDQLESINKDIESVDKIRRKVQEAERKERSLDARHRKEQDELNARHVQEREELMTRNAGKKNALQFEATRDLDQHLEELRQRRDDIETQCKDVANDYSLQRFSNTDSAHRSSPSPAPTALANTSTSAFSADINGTDDTLTCSLYTAPHLLQLLQTETDHDEQHNPGSHQAKQDHPTVVTIDGQLVAISCHLCGANANLEGGEFFKGIEGLGNHYRSAHRQHPVVKDFSNLRVREMCHKEAYTGQKIKRVTTGTKRRNRKKWESDDESTDDHEGDESVFVSPSRASAVPNVSIVHESSIDSAARGQKRKSRAGRPEYRDETPDVGGDDAYDDGPMSKRKVEPQPTQPLSPSPSNADPAWMEFIHSPST